MCDTECCRQKLYTLTGLQRKAVGTHSGPQGRQSLRKQPRRHMVCSVMLRSVALVGIDVSEELSASSIRVTRIGEPGTTLAVTSNLMEAQSSSETSVLTRITLRNIPEDTILHSHRRENLKSYMRQRFRQKTHNCVLCGSRRKYFKFVGRIYFGRPCSVANDYPPT
jgi:hypothetical protein